SWCCSCSASQALPLEEGGEQEEKKEGGEVTVDMSTKILTGNNGSDEMLLEGDIVLPKNRNTMTCWYNSCLWSKASNDCEFTSYERQTVETGMRAFASGTCVRFQQHCLNLIQNADAPVLTKTRKMEYITPALKSLHWL
ncbi:hypothetical protein CCH79_00004811, partial [Gambusia affinis]